MEHSQVRVIEQNGEPWFVAKDVCGILELSDTNKAVHNLDDDEKLLRKIFVSGQNRDVTTISESGLYTLIIRSNKPEAKHFRKWVTSEVIPSIRKHGAYMTEQTLEKALTNPVFIGVYNCSSFRRFYVRLMQNSEKIYKQLQGVFGTHY